MGEERTDSSVMSGCCRWAYGLRLPLRRSLTATIAPICSGAPLRRMYARMCGAKYPPAPASTGMLNGGAIDSAHMAFDSDCFSNATASTRRCTPAWTRLVATIPVVPPTEPAVCTRSSGLPTAPSASARYSSGIITPSNRSGAFPTTTASISAWVAPASARARSTASRQSPAMDTSLRRARCRVCPTPRTAAGCFIVLPGSLASGAPLRHRLPSSLVASLLAPQSRRRRAPSARSPGLHHAHEVLLQGRAAGGVAERAAGPAGDYLLCRRPDPRQARGEHRVAGQDAARWIDRCGPAQTQDVTENNLLMRERRVQLRDLDPRCPGRAPGLGRGRRGGQVAGAQRRRVDPVLEASDPGRALAQLAGPLAGGEDHDRGPVPDRRAVVRAQRLGDVGLAEQLLGGDLAGQLRPRVRHRGGAAVRRDLGHVLLAPHPRLDAEPGLQRGDAHRVGPERGQQVRVELQR